MSNPQTTPTPVYGSGTAEGCGSAEIRANSTSGVKNFPAEGRIGTKIFRASIFTTLPSASLRNAVSNVAVNVAEVIAVRSETSRSAGVYAPGPRLPTEIVKLGPAVKIVIEAFLKRVSVNTGKSGAREKPPVEGSPVRLLMLKTFTPGSPGRPGMSVLYENTPIFIEAAGQATASNTPTAINLNVIIGMPPECGILNIH